MTLRLILSRHGKSSWDDPFLDDHDRPLNKRGQRGAAAVARWLADNDFLPAEVVSSTARRTVETWEHMAPAFPDGTLLRREPTLYHAGPHRMLDVLRHCAASPVLMLGHNPGIADFAASLVIEPPAHPRFDDYPTCATLVAEFDVRDWAEAGCGTARVLAFAVPADLGVRK